jgi:hypothetical protein
VAAATVATASEGSRGMIAQRERPAYDQRRWLQGKIHDVAKRLGMPEQDRRDFMMDLVGENSCRDMTHPQLKKVLWALTHKTDRSPSHRPVTAMTPIGEVVRKTTDYILKRSGRDERLPLAISSIEQGKMIEALFADLELGACPPKGWRSALSMRVCKRPWPQTRSEANRLIECLKNMRSRNWHPRASHG